MRELEKKAFRILLNNSDKAPYDENASAEVLSTFNAAVRGQLLRLDASFQLLPGMISKWHWDFAKSAYILTLNDEIVFHNGRKADARDLEFSLLRGFFTEKRTFYKIFLGNIRGIEKPLQDPSLKFSSGVVDGVKVSAPLTVEVQLNSPNPSFLYSLVNPYFSLAPIEELHSDYVTWKHLPMGAGPYKVIEAFNDGVIRLERVIDNKNIPHRIDLLTRNSNDFQISLIKPTQFFEGMKSQYSKYPITMSVLHFSNIHPLGRNEDFRKAIQFAVDRKGVLEGLDDHTPLFEFLPRHFWGRNGLQDPFDLDQAKKHFARLPIELRSQKWNVGVFSGKEFSESLKIRTKRLREQFEKIGFNVDFFPTQNKFNDREAASKNPMTMSGRVADLVDPLIVFAALKKDSPYEFDRPLKSDEFESLFEDAAKAEGKPSRLKSIQTLSAFIDKEAIVVPISELRQAIFYDSNIVESLGNQDQPMTFFIDRIIIKK